MDIYDIKDVPAEEVKPLLRDGWEPFGVVREISSMLNVGGVIDNIKGTNFIFLRRPIAGELSEERLKAGGRYEVQECGGTFEVLYYENGERKIEDLKTLQSLLMFLGKKLTKI